MKNLQRFTLMAMFSMFSLNNALEAQIPQSPQPVPSCVKERDFSNGVTTPLVYGLAKAEIDCLVMAAKAGNNDAAYRLYENYSLGLNPDEVQAVKWLRFAAENKDIRSQLQLGSRLVQGHYGLHPKQEEIDEGISWWKKAAANGDGGAMGFLAAYYKKLPNQIEARAWLIKAADAGNGAAALELLDEGINQNAPISDVLPKMSKYISLKIEFNLKLKKLFESACSRPVAENLQATKDKECNSRELKYKQDLEQDSKLLESTRALQKNEHDVQARAVIEALVIAGSSDAVKLRDYLKHK